MSNFYEQLVDFYDLIYVDWSRSAMKQGADLSALIRGEWPKSKQVLDVSCGIGTQAIGLSAQGFEVTGSDLSSVEIDRAKLLASERGFKIPYSVCDMREVHKHHGETFDVVISCDNSIAHLLDDDALSEAFSSIFRCVTPGGGCILSVRDYANEPRSKNILKPYGVRVREGRRYVIYQLWDFFGDIYDLAFCFVEEDLQSGETKTHVMRSKCYAVSIPRIEELMEAVGFENVCNRTDAYFQPCILGTRPV